MGNAAYRITPYQGGWGVQHDGSTKGPYETKEAAFEATVMAASNALREGQRSRSPLPGEKLSRAAAARRRDPAEA